MLILILLINPLECCILFFCSFIICSILLTFLRVIFYCQAIVLSSVVCSLISYVLVAQCSLSASRCLYRLLYLLFDACIVCSVRLSSSLSPGDAYYLAIGGGVAEHNWNHIRTVLQDRGFQCELTDHSEDMGMISIQGPKRWGQRRGDEGVDGDAIVIDTQAWKR